MKDKDIYNLIDNIGDIDKLDIDFDEIFENEDIEVDDRIINEIRNKTYNKIGTIKLKKYKYKKVISLVASIALIITIGTPIALAIVDKLYKYNPTNGNIIKSENPIYVLKEPITKELNGGTITLKSLVINPKNKYIEIDDVGNEIYGFENRQTKLKINNEEITLMTQASTSSSWSGGTASWNCKYKTGDKVVYSIILIDSSNKETIVDFDVDLVEASSISDYNRMIPKDTKNNVTISAITKEENNNLYVELMAIPAIEKFDFNIYNYGNYVNDLNGTNIFLIDANNKKVEAEYVLEDNVINKFKFNTKDLEKPFNIQLNDISVNINNTDFYGTNFKSKKVKLPKLKFGETLEVNKDISVYDKNNNITRESNNVKINKIERKEVDKVDSYVVYVEYPDNKNTPIKLQSLMIHPTQSFFGFGSFKFTSSSQSRGKDRIYNEIVIYMENADYIDYKERDKKKGIEFKISPSSYIIEGPWNLTIE